MCMWGEEPRKWEREKEGEGEGEGEGGVEGKGEGESGERGEGSDGTYVRVRQDGNMRSCHVS